jgi:hypothetical protein
MATYIDEDNNSANGRIYRVQATEIRVDDPDAEDGFKQVLTEGVVANIEAADVPFASLTAAAEAYNDLLTALKDAGVMEADS